MKTTEAHAPGCETQGWVASLKGTMLRPHTWGAARYDETVNMWSQPCKMTPEEDTGAGTGTS